MKENIGFLKSWLGALRALCFLSETSRGFGFIASQQHLTVHCCMKYLNTEFKSISQLRLIILIWSFLKGLYQSCVNLFGWENHPKGIHSQGRWGFLGLCCPSIPSAPPSFGIFVQSQLSPMELAVQEDSCQCWAGAPVTFWEGILCQRGCPWPQSPGSHLEEGIGNAQGADLGKLTLCSITAPQNVGYSFQRMLKQRGWKSVPESLECCRHWGTALGCIQLMEHWFSPG